MSDSRRGYTRKFWIVTGFVVLVNLLALPLTLIFLMTFASALSPMQVVFLTTAEVRNLTDEPVLVTPVGATELSAQRVLLPTYRASRFAWSRDPLRDEPLMPGASL